MKPQPPFSLGSRRHHPLTDFCFQSGLSDWRGSSWSGDDDDSPAHRFNKFNRDLLRESRRKRQCEMIVFGFIMLIAGWPVVFMICNVISLFLNGNPFGL